MAPDRIFTVASNLTMLTWIALILLPRRPVVPQVIAGTVVPALLATAYAAIVAVSFGSTQGGFTSLADVALLFGNPWMLLAGWIHYLAFDLLIGVWEVRDAQSRGIAHWLVIPCLLLTFMFGPVGWLLYMGLRTVRSR